MTDRRRTFVPVVGLGLLSAALAAVASTRPWVVASEASPARHARLPDAADVGQMPLAVAVSLVLLACWGVLLVTRRVVRRGVAVLGLVASLGLLATVWAGLTTLPDRVTEAARENGALSDTVGSELTGWLWVAAGTSLLSVAASALAAAWSPAWPEMGSRYDAPGATAPGERQGDPTNLDLWKSMDEGRDPTA